MNLNNKKSKQIKISKPNKEIPFIYTDEIPDNESNPDFWSSVENPHFRNSLNFLIINEIRKNQVINLTDNQCRSVLAKLEGYVSMLDLPKAIIRSTEEQEELIDEIPE